MNFTIDKELLALCPNAALLVLEYDALVTNSPDALTALLDETIQSVHKQYTLADLAELPPIRDTRSAYRQLGKPPTTYRNAAEAMLRRIVKGNGLYRINNVVDINNLMSISTRYSIGSYDTDCLTGGIEWKRAPAEECYQGIGKDVVNIEYLPTLYDSNGAFGNPTSDSRQAMITTGKHRIASVVYSFSGRDEFDAIAEKYGEWLIAYCGAAEITKRIVDCHTIIVQ